MTYIDLPSCLNLEILLEEVPKMLWFIAISVHDLTPPDVSALIAEKQLTSYHLDK